MADGVQVKFGANITDLVEGINSAVGELRSFAEAVGAMYVADKTAEFIAQFGDMGEKIERATAIFGASTKDVQELQLANELAGGSAESFGALVDRLQQSLQRAQVPTSQQALALKAIGLSASQLIGVPLPEQFDRIADAVSKFADGGNKTAIVMALLGRGGAEMIPTLDLGRAGLDQMRQSAEDAATVMSGQTVSALATMKQSTTLLEASLKSLGGTIMGQVAPSITEFDNQLAHSVGNITALIATGQISDFVMKALGSDMLLVADYAKLLAQAFTDLVLLNWGEFSKHWKENMDAVEADANESLGQVDDVLERARQQYKALLDQANETNKGLKQPPAIGYGNQDALKAEMEAIQAEVAAQNTYYQSQVEHINSLAKTFQIGEQQKTQMLLAAVDQREAFQIAELQQAIGLQGQTQASYQKLQDELTKIKQKATADRQKITDQAAQEQEKTWKAAADQISSAFGSQLKGLLASTTSWSQAMKNVAGDLIIKMIEDAVKFELEWLASQARVLAGHLASETAMTSATAAGASARTAAEQRSAASGMLANIAATVQAIMRDAAQAFAGVFAFLAPVMGPAAAGPAAAAQASVSAAAIFDVGTDYVVRGGLALIHPGETIIPAARGSGPFSGGMGTQVHAPVSINVSALDSQSVARFFNDNSKHMLRAINDAVKRGAHLGLRAIHP
ncbi:MAG: hypothetical protein WBF58_09910 [Xanthobacteraceae bacterium]